MTGSNSTAERDAVIEYTGLGRNASPVLRRIAGIVVIVVLVVAVVTLIALD